MKPLAAGKPVSATGLVCPSDRTAKPTPGKPPAENDWAGPGRIGQLHAADPRRAVDWMLATMEGIKQRAAFEPEICTPDERETMVQGLVRILGQFEPPRVRSRMLLDKLTIPGSMAF
jgi:hypothetical protein